ncbi:hypothetical protein [Ferruginibacter profundus]
MNEWELNIEYNLKPYKLKAELEYHSAQIMRIRVHGIKSSILLENNYPILRLAKNKRGIQWKIREGSMGEGTEKTARLLTTIMEYLESLLKKDYP